ncbi:50S ribosomal protein L25 [Lagierella sp.]|uniref:50S ribosomal protein L25 n=1 Tax=Lagierella sp. TaxID=2849657 RepID=UPI0026193E28|nr:50S ribosomal protein L25 [Lagierella sp.]
MTDFKIDAQIRKGTGKNKVDKLRVEKKVPGVIYQRGEENINLELLEQDLDKLYLEAGTSNLITLNIDGDSRKALIKDVQKHPFKNQYIHVDFVGVDMSEKMRVVIPIVLEGRDEIKVQPSVLMQILNEIEVECLPADLPSEAVVEVQDMEIGDTVTVEDLDVFKDEKVEIFMDPEETVATLTEPREEEIEEEVEEVDAADVPTVEETEQEEEEADEE